MNAKIPSNQQSIIDCLRNDYGIDAVMILPLALGADMDALIYQVQSRQNVYFVKLKKGHHHSLSLKIVELLYQAGIKEIIAPVKTLLGQSYKHINDSTLIVYPFIHGQDGFSQTLTDEQWILLGKVLHQVHHLKIPADIQHNLRKEAYSPKWREIIRSLYTHIETKTKVDELAMKLSVFMIEQSTIIHALVNRAEQYAQRLQKLSPPFVLCHSDIHGGNVLISENGALFIVDWDEPMMAPKERDLMFIGGGVANVWNKPHETALFYQGYGHTTVNREILAYYRHERINEDIALYGQALLLPSANDENRSILFQHFMDMFNPNGVVDIAFKTDSASLN